MDYKKFLKKIGFAPKEGSSDVFIKTYQRGYKIEVNFESQTLNYGKKITAERKTTQNFSQSENWVVLECVDRLLEKGYKPENIILEKTWGAGHGTSGRLDICVTREDGSEYLLIECKTYGKEFDKEFVRMKSDGGQLFTYFKFSNKADVIMLYASELNDNKIIFKNEIVKIEDDYRVGDVKDFYEKWSKLTKDNGVFDSWVKPYDFESKALTIHDLVEIRQEDSSFIFNRFLEILRHNVVSDKGNAFNRIFTLFLCKIYDEKTNEGTDNELGFQWLEGIDNHRSFQIRLTDLYKNGMQEFLEKVVTDFSETEFNNKFSYLTDKQRGPILEEFRKIRLEKNNEFAIKDVYDEQSFNENAVVVKEIVQLLEKYKLRYTKKQQYLSDFFELLLTTGLKQESGQFFTPVPVAQFVIKSLPIDTILEARLTSTKIENDTLLPYVIDYAAGSGHFLTETMHEMQRLIDKKDDKKYHPNVAKKIRNWKDDHFAWAINYVYGIEKDYRLVKVGKVGCYLHGDGLANVIHSDGLARFSHSDYKGKLKLKDKDFPQDNRAFDILVSNPPYSVSAFKNSARSFYKEGDFQLYAKLTDNSSEIECLFIERTKQLLKDGGVAGIILPSSILSNSGIYTKSREIILQYFDIIGITELGGNTFMATGTNTVVLFLRRRDNYQSIKLRTSINAFFTNLIDVTTNGIEKPVDKYVKHVWKGLTFKDYLTLLEKSPSKMVTNHEIYLEYRKKIKAKTEKEYWEVLLEKEIEKLYYFIIAYPQKIVLVKSGEKDAEKRFLGYEFSNRRGSEGIHPLQRGKNIEDITQLFHPDEFEHPEKASTYIYKAFQGDFDTPIHESLKANITRHQLVDMLSFDRVDFEKNISLAIKKKVKIESRWDIVKLEDVIELISGQSPESEFYNQNKKGQPFYQGKTEFGDTFLNDPIYWTEKITKESIRGDVLMTVRAPVGPVNINPFEKICIGRGLNALRATNKISNVYLFYYLKSNQDRIKGNDGAIFESISRDQILSLKIPLPPKHIQEKIVAEIEILEEKEKNTKQEVEELKNHIQKIIESTKGKMIDLQSITTKIGSGATPLGGEGSYKSSGIRLIRSQNVYDNEFYEKGLAFIDNEQAEKLNNVAVEKNDILFNITGASIARSCIVPEKYLPARVNQHVSIIRTNNKALPKFVQSILISPVFKNQLLQIGDGATSREAITKAQLENFKVPLPSISEQQKIVSEIEKIEGKIKELENKIMDMPKQKETVLKKYL